MRWLRPSDGASSIAPDSFTHSACTPRAAKWRRVTSGYLVAMRTWLQRRGSSLPAISTGSATASRHLPMPRSIGA